MVKLYGFSKTGKSGEKTITPKKKLSSRPAYNPSYGISRMAEQFSGVKVTRTVAPSKKSFVKRALRTTGKITKATGRGIAKSAKFGYLAGKEVRKEYKGGAISRFNKQAAEKGGYANLYYSRGRQLNKQYREGRVEKQRYLTDIEEQKARRAEFRLRRVTAPEALRSREQEYNFQRSILGEEVEQEPGGENYFGNNVPRSSPPKQYRRTYYPLSDKQFRTKKKQPGFFD